MLNHAMRTLMGFAASTAPPISRQCSGPGKSSAAGSSAMVHSASRKRKSLHGSGKQAPRRAEHRHAGEVREGVELRHPLVGVGQRAVEVVEAREAGVAVVGAVRVLAVQQALAGELDLVARVVGEEPRLGRVAQRRLQGHRRQHEADDRATHAATTIHARQRRISRPAPIRIARPIATSTAAVRGMPTSHSPSVARTSAASGPEAVDRAGLELAGRVGRDGRDDEDGEAEHRAAAPRAPHGGRGY